MSLHAVVSSDWHLMGMSKVIKNTCSQQFAEIKKVYEYALENGIKHVIVPGDLSHIPKLGDDEFIALLSLLLTYSDYVTTYYICGNHDVEHKHKTALDILWVIASTGMIKNFYVYKQPTVKKIDGVYVNFMPFPATEVLPTKKPPLVVAHIETAGAIGDNGRPLKHGHEIKRQKGDFIVTGHLHKHQFLKKKRILYVGSLYQTNFGEDLPKGFLDLKARYKDGELIVKYEYVINKPNFVLETKLIRSQEDWNSLKREESVRYRVFVDDGIVIPKKITQDLTNIIQLSGLSKKSVVEMEQLIKEGQALPSASFSSIPQLKITHGLKRFLKKNNLDKKTCKIAVTLAKEAANSLGIS